MEIRYTTRSEFFEPMERALNAHGGCPDQDNPLELSLSEEGYNGEVLVEIVPDPDDVFLSDWEGNDPTRFPARIRAAATILRRRKCFGRFLIAHRMGHLTIVRAPW